MLAEQTYKNVPLEQIPTTRERMQKAENVILKCVREGDNLKTACGIAGVLYRTAQDWITNGNRALADGVDPEEDDFARFARDYERAKSWYIRDLRGRFEKAMDVEPKTAGIYLEFVGRNHPEELGRRQVVKVDQDTTLHVVWEEKTGAQWQVGQAVEQAALPPGTDDTDQDGVVDTEMVMDE